jgi:hypothetical protein
MRALPSRVNLGLSQERSNGGIGRTCYSLPTAAVGRGNAALRIRRPAWIPALPFASRRKVLQQK